MAKWVTVAVVGLAAIAAAFGQATSKPAAKEKDDYAIEEYRFSWMVVESGDVELEVCKDEETTSILLSRDYDMLRMTPATAQEVGKALGQTEKYYSSLRGKTARDQKVKAGDCVVTFSYDPKTGFSVFVRSGETFALTSVLLDRKEAKAVAPAMLDAPKRAAFVDRKIRL